MKRLVIALCLFASPAYAVDAPPQIKPTDTFAVTMQASQWNAVIASIRDSDAISAREASELAASIQQQIMSKVQPAKK